MVAVLINSIAAMAVNSRCNSAFAERQWIATPKVKRSLTQLKANMIGRQDTASSASPMEPEWKPIHAHRSRSTQDSRRGHEWGRSGCPKPSKMGGRTIATTKLRLLSIRNTQNDFDNNDLKILISPEAIAINTIGGVAGVPNKDQNR